MIDDLTIDVYNKNDNIKTQYYVNSDIEHARETISRRKYNLDTNNLIDAFDNATPDSNFKRIGNRVTEFEVDDAYDFFMNELATSKYVNVYANHLSEANEDFFNAYNRMVRDPSRVAKIFEPDDITLSMANKPSIELIVDKAFYKVDDKNVAIDDVKDKLQQQLYETSWLFPEIAGDIETMLPDNIELDLDANTFSIVPIHFKVIYPNGTYKRVSAVSVAQLEEELDGITKKSVAVVRVIRRGHRRYHAYVVFKVRKNDQIVRYPEMYERRNASPASAEIAKGKTKRFRFRLLNKKLNKKKSKSKQLNKSKKLKLIRFKKFNKSKKTRNRKTVKQHGGLFKFSSKKVLPFSSKKVLPKDVMVFKDYLEKLVKESQEKAVKESQEKAVDESEENVGEESEDTVGDESPFEFPYFQRPNSQNNANKFVLFRIFNVKSITTSIVPVTSFFSEDKKIYSVKGEYIYGSGTTQPATVEFPSNMEDLMNTEIKVYKTKPADISNEEKPWDDISGGYTRRRISRRRKTNKNK